MKAVSIGSASLETDVRGSGDPVVLVQTALMADELQPVANRLVSHGGFRVVQYHRRGYGRSSPADGPSSIEREAHDCRDLLAALDIDRAHLVGVSFSAAIALHLTVDDPARIHTVTAIEPPPMQIPDAAAFIAANHDLMETYRSDGGLAALDRFLTRLMGLDWREELESLLPGSVSGAERHADTFFGSDIPALLAWEFDRRAASRLDRPTLYIGGSESGPWFTAVRDLMVDWLPTADCVVIPQAGHNLAVTHPDDVAWSLIEFFGRHSLSQ